MSYYFDLFGGTSTGGLIALALINGISLDKIESLYLTPGIFDNLYTSQPMLQNLFSEEKSLYSPKNLRTGLENMFDRKSFQTRKKRQKCTLRMLIDFYLYSLLFIFIFIFLSLRIRFIFFRRSLLQVRMNLLENQ